MIKSYSLKNDGEKNLSPHFKVKEFRPKWNGLPDGDIVKIDDDLIEKLELLSDCINNAPIYINDGYRTTEFDIHLTGKAGQHTTGRAADIQAKGYNSEQLAVIAEFCNFDGIGIINKNSIHVDTRGYKKRFIEHGVKSGTESVVVSFLNKCNWIHILKFKKRLITNISFPEIRDTVKNYANKFNESDTYIANGGFFCTSKNAVFNYLTNGYLANKHYDHLYGIGIDNKNELIFGNINEHEYRDFLSGHPVLIDNYLLCDLSYANEIRQENPRTAIGYNNLYTYLISIDGRTSKAKGLTLNGLRQLVKYIGCKYAINLDGGGSTALYHSGKPINNPTENRVINNAIMIKYEGELL